MKKKIYNKKKFWSGIVFLVLAAISVPVTIIRFNNIDTLINIKHIIVDIFCILFGVTEVYRSLSSKCTREDKLNDDEREKLITIKSKSRAYNITFFICIAITLLSIIAAAATKNLVLLGIFIGIAIVPTIMIIAELSSYFYFDKRN